MTNRRATLMWGPSGWPSCSLIFLVITNRNWVDRSNSFVIPIPIPSLIVSNFFPNQWKWECLGWFLGTTTEIYINITYINAHYRAPNWHHFPRWIHGRAWWTVSPPYPVHWSEWEALHVNCEVIMAPRRVCIISQKQWRGGGI